MRRSTPEALPQQGAMGPKVKAMKAMATAPKKPEPKAKLGAPPKGKGLPGPKTSSPALTPRERLDAGEEVTSDAWVTSNWAIGEMFEGRTANLLEQPVKCSWRVENAEKEREGTSLLCTLIGVEAPKLSAMKTSW